MWNKLSSKVIFKHPRLIVEEDTVVLQSGQKTHYLRYGSDGDGVVIVAKNDIDQVLFIREYSYVPNRMLLQLPMGKIQDGETAVIAGNRELQEEAGFRAGHLTEVGSYYQNHRRSDNKAHVVLAADLVESPLQSDAEEEDIVVVWVSTGDISSKIRQNEIIDADTLCALRICGL